MLSKNHPLATLAESLPGLLNEKRWVAAVVAADQALRRPDIPGVLRAAYGDLSAGIAQHALAGIGLALHWHPDRTLDEIRRQGLFRSSKYRFQASHVRRVITVLLSEADRLSLSEAIIQYLQSVSNLLRLSSAVRNLDISLREFIARRKDQALKTVVAIVDSLFALDHQANYSLSSENWQHYSKEVLAEAGSYIIHCFDAEVGLRDDHFNFMDETGLASGLYHKLLVKACKIREFLEAEILVDAFDYRCALRGHAARIDPPFPELEMSIRLGFIQNEQAAWRQRIERIAAISKGLLSLDKAADLYYDKYRDQVAVLVEEPIKRFVFRFPDIPPLRAFFNENTLLVEESLYLKEVLESELVTLDELKKFEIRKGVSVFDLLKVYRLFGFVSHIAKRHLGPLFEQESVLAYRSLVPVFRITQLEQILGWCLPEVAISPVIDMLSWTAGAKDTVDLQYRPFLKALQHCLTPLSIAGTINWYRNLAYTQRNRVMEIAEEEAASRALEATLRGATPHVRKGFETTLKGKRFEVDVLARFGDYLFVFECKHSLLPCNPHEMRTSYDHMKKAARQLGNVKDLLEDNNAEVELYRRLGWQLLPASRIITCIVSCNGMFPGLVLEGHPIRRWAELRNAIETGEVRLGSVQFAGSGDGEMGVNADDLVERSIWGGPELTPEFLRKYIEDGLLQQPLFRAMGRVERSYRFEKWTLVFTSFALDVVAAQENVRKLFAGDDLTPESQLSI